MFNQIEQAKEDIIVAGQRALVSLYGGAKKGRTRCLAIQAVL